MIILFWVNVSGARGSAWSGQQKWQRQPKQMVAPYTAVNWLRWLCGPWYYVTRWIPSACAQTDLVFLPEIYYLLHICTHHFRSLDARCTFVGRELLIIHVWVAGIYFHQSCGKMCMRTGCPICMYVGLHVLYVSSCVRATYNVYSEQFAIDKIDDESQRIRRNRV